MKLPSLVRDQKGAAAVEMMLVTPFLLALMFGAVEVGNYFLSEHALEKQVRDGARYGARLAIANPYSCPGSVFADPNATTQIINVTKTGAVTGSGFARWQPGYWAQTCGSDTQSVTVNISCVAKTSIDTEGTGDSGIYTGLVGTNIPVVTVAARVKYPSVLSTLGFNAVNVCMTAESKAAVQGI